MLDRVDEEHGADDDAAERDQHLQVDDPQPGRQGRVDPESAHVHPAEAERREFLLLVGAVRLEMPAHVPRVDPDQEDCDKPAEDGRVLRKERRADRDAVRDREVAHVVGDHARIDAQVPTGGATPRGRRGSRHR